VSVPPDGMYGLMSRYYFNVRRGSTVFVDHAGVMLPGLAEAWTWAVKDAVKLIRQGQIDWVHHRYWMEVCDNQRCAVVAFPIGPVTMH